MHRDPFAGTRSLTILGAQDVAAQLHGRERELIALAAQAYTLHGAGQSSLPQSEYLRFAARGPGHERDRIIPKAGYLGGPHPACGIKWIASFPANVDIGLPRASALIVLNCLHTGRPTAVMEGSLISAQRTAAGAALAARLVHPGPAIDRLGLVGCGPIGRETLRFVLADERPVAAIELFDLDLDRAQAMTHALRELGFGGQLVLHRSASEVLRRCALTVFATSAVTPSVQTLDMCGEHSTVLHVSLRDFSVGAVLQADNLADDIGHVLQANTSVHLAQQQLGHHDFLRATLADVMAGTAAARASGKPVMVHPFGLAALDLAFAQFVQQRASATGAGTQVPGFLA